METDYCLRSVSTCFEQWLLFLKRTIEMEIKDVQLVNAGRDKE